MRRPHRGEIWTIAGGGGRYTSKPRPAIIIQSDAFPDTDSLTVIMLTTTQLDSPVRIPVPANSHTGIQKDSFAQTDKVVTVDARRLGDRCGELNPATLREIDRAILVFFGIAH